VTWDTSARQSPSTRAERRRWGTEEHRRSPRKAR
jgi:hypothetical protein